MKIIPLLLAFGIAVGGFVMPSLPSAAEVGAVDIVAAPTLAGVLRPNQSLLVTGTVTNRTGQRVDEVAATLHISSSRMGNRSAVARWLSDKSSVADPRIGEALGEAIIGELAIGQTRSFSIAVPPTSLEFMNGETGAFPLEIHVTAGGVALATHRSVVSWYPESSAPRVSLAVATPLNAPPSSNGLLTAESLNTLMSPGGELYDQLEMARLHSVAIGVDPMIIASIRLLGDEAPQSAIDWLQQLDGAPNDIFTLSYADSDQLLLRRAGITEPLAPISFPNAEKVAPAPQKTPTQNVPSPSSTGNSGTEIEPVPGNPLALRTTIDGLAWPASVPTSEDELAFVEAGGFTRTLLSSSEIAGSSLATPNATIGKHQVTVSDNQISDLLRAASDAVTEGEWAGAIANLTATLAVTAAQSPGSTVVATFARTVSPNSRLMNNTLGAIESLPWVNSTSLRNALNAAPVSGSIPDRADEEDSDSDRLLLTKELISSENTLAQFSSVADDATLVTGPQRLQLLSLVSAMWADDLPGWDAAVRDHLVENSVLLDSVRIPEGSFVNFPLEKGNLPITVRNELSFPVTVYLTVRAERAILNVTDDWVKLKIEANSQTKAYVPVESIANGEVVTTVSLSSSSGVPISKPTIVTLNVQAGWETTATVVLAIIVIGLFGAGIWRTVLRRRSLRTARNTSGQE